MSYGPLQIDEAFPPLYDPLNPTKASSADTAAQNSPYRAGAGRLTGPAITLRPPVATVPSDDPTLAAIADLQDAIRRLHGSIRTLSAPWIVQPPDSESFHTAAGIVIPAQDGAFHVVVQITVPPGRNGVLNKIANEFVGGGFQDFSGNIIYQILRNPGVGISAAERNFENIQASLGTPAVPGQIAGIRLYENDVIQLVVKNARIAPAGEFIGGLLGGWFYPRTWEDRYEAFLAEVSS